jgi:hypothetical protein
MIGILDLEFYGQAVEFSAIGRLDRLNGLDQVLRRQSRCKSEGIHFVRSDAERFAIKQHRGFLRGSDSPVFEARDLGIRNPAFGSGDNRGEFGLSQSAIRPSVSNQQAEFSAKSL